MDRSRRHMTHAVATTCMIPQKKGSFFFFFFSSGTGILLTDETGRIVSITAQVARGFPGMVHTGAARAGVEVRTAVRQD